MEKILAVSVLIASLVSSALLLENLAGKGEMPRVTAQVASALSDQSAATSTAPDETASSTPSLRDVLQQLQDQEIFLTNEIAGLHQEIDSLKQPAATPDLKRGDSGDAVRLLQQKLAAASLIASSSITGHFGQSTFQALANFQKQRGLPQTGIADATTRTALMIPDATGLATSSTPSFLPIDLSMVSDLSLPQTVAWIQGQISQLAIDDTTNQSALSDMQNQVTLLAVQVSDLQTTAAPTPSATSASTPLAITAIQAINITKNAATITWMTNTNASSEVDYSTNSSLPTGSQTKSTINLTMTTTHSIPLSALTAGTKYYYRIISTANGVSVKSVTASFSTAN